MPNLHLHCTAVQSIALGQRFQLCIKKLVHNCASALCAFSLLWHCNLVIRIYVAVNRKKNISLSLWKPILCRISCLSILLKAFWIDSMHKMCMYTTNQKQNLPCLTFPYNSENKPRRLYFSRALFEGLIFGGAYPRREIWVSKSIGPAL